MNKKWKIAVGIIGFCFVYLLIVNKWLYGSFTLTPKISPVVQNEPVITSEEKLTEIQQKKRVFNDLGWRLYANQFKNPQPDGADKCFIDMDTCDYWKAVASEYNVRVEDVKYTLYSVSHVALNAERQKLYDDFNLGLNAIKDKTDLNAEKYVEFFSKKYGLEEYELRAIIAKGDFYKK